MLKHKRAGVSDIMIHQAIGCDSTMAPPLPASGCLFRRR
jgi:hypothetical protein